MRQLFFKLVVISFSSDVRSSNERTSLKLDYYCYRSFSRCATSLKRTSYRMNGEDSIFSGYRFGYDGRTPAVVPDSEMMWNRQYHQCGLAYRHTTGEKFMLISRTRLYHILPRRTVIAPLLLPLIQMLLPDVNYIELCVHQFDHCTNFFLWFSSFCCEKSKRSNLFNQ